MERSDLTLPWLAGDPSLEPGIADCRLDVPQGCKARRETLDLLNDALAGESDCTIRLDSTQSSKPQGPESNTGFVRVKRTACTYGFSKSLHAAAGLQSYATFASKQMPVAVPAGPLSADAGSAACCEQTCSGEKGESKRPTLVSKITY